MEIVILWSKPYVLKIRMLPNLIPIIAMLIVMIPIILLMILPALIELKKPKDGGPRIIMGGVPEVTLSALHVIPIANMEDEQNFDCSLIQTMAKIISVLPSLEV